MFLLALLAVACGLSAGKQVRPAGSTLLSHETKAGERPNPVSKAKGSAPTASLDLREFQPLLDRSEFREVRKALAEDDDPGEAARRLSVLIPSLEQAPGDDGLLALRAHYLQGLLFVRSGQLSGAEQAFQSAAKETWILREDALVHLAEVELALGRAEASLTAFSEVVSLAAEPRVLRTKARAWSALKDEVRALSEWRLLVKASPDPEARIALAGALLTVAEATEKGVSRDALLREAVDEAQQAGLGLSENDPRVKGAKELLVRAQRSGAVIAQERPLALRLAHLRGLVEAAQWEEAETVATQIALPPSREYLRERCEADFLVGRVLSAQRKWGEGAERVTPAAQRCQAEKDLHPWLLFNAGKYSAADGRHTKAVVFYADLEAQYPQSSLADDARFRAAQSYLKMGSSAKFMDLLSRIADDYPDGDTTMEGVLTLALHRMERKDWSGAAQVLERASEIIRPRDSARGHEHAGTERYFLAKVKQELGREEEALSEYESIVREVPLSYYMLHAYSRLMEADPARARAALEEGLRIAREETFQFPHRREYETDSFKRGLELLRVGERERGQEILGKLGLEEGAEDSLLWGMALLYDRAGDAHTAHSIARGRLSDWLSHYPAGDWQGAWEIGFPRPYLSLVSKGSRETGVPEWLIYGVMREESTFRAEVVSHANAYGLMQIIEPTARGIGKKANIPYSPLALKNPKNNIAIGSRVLEELGRQFKVNPWLAIPGYNAGPGRPKTWLRERPDVDFDVWVEMIPYRETRRYTKRVLASRAAYAFVYYREDAATALVLPKRLTPP